jgi:hypothetical protein
MRVLLDFGDTARPDFTKTQVEGGGMGKCGFGLLKTYVFGGVFVENVKEGDRFEGKLNEILDFFYEFCYF